MTKTLLFLFVFFMSAPSWANTGDGIHDYSGFAKIPVVHDGRVKPLDSVARIHLRKLSNDDAYVDMSAAQWLASSLFDPQSMQQERLVVIDDERLVSALNITSSDDHRYSYREVRLAYDDHREKIMSLAQKGEDQLNEFESVFLNLYIATHDYSQLLHTFSLIQPYEVPLSEAYRNSVGLNESDRHYLDFLKAKEQIITRAKSVMDAKGQVAENYSDGDQEALALAIYMARAEALGAQNRLLRVMPAYLHDKTEWHSPWELINEGYGSPRGSELLALWEQLAQAYRTGDQALFSETARTVITFTDDARNVSAWQLALEIVYHTYPLLVIAGVCYGLTFLLLCLSQMMRRSFDHVSMWLMRIGVLSHALLLAMRIAILERPPVSTLYESIVFVSLVVVALGLWLGKRSEHQEGLWLASGLGVCLLALSDAFAQQGDTLGVVMAVLNTNFWLATHVICITMGYGAALVAGAMAHIYLWGRSGLIGKHLHLMTLIALLLTAVGTILGGIWADQSWGRFWGWDPKENGALAIVLWLVWVLHGRLTGHFNMFRFAAWLCAVNIVVALSWFGVNLLSVGLHSYGFTEGAAYWLAAFCIGELVLIIALVIRARCLQKVSHEK